MSRRAGSTLLRVIAIGALCVFALLAVLVLGDWLERRGRKDVVSKGTELVAALDAYHAANNHYPATLADLVPAFLDEVRMPRWGNREWEYARYKQGDGFSLQVCSNGRDCYPSISYSSGGGQWLVDQ